MLSFCFEIHVAHRRLGAVIVIINYVVIHLVLAVLDRLVHVHFGYRHPQTRRLVSHLILFALLFPLVRNLALNLSVVFPLSIMSGVSLVSTYFLVLFKYFILSIDLEVFLVVYLICQLYLILIYSFIIHFFQLVPVSSLLVPDLVQIADVVPWSSWDRMMRSYLFDKRNQGLIMVFSPLDLHICIVIKKIELAEVAHRFAEDCLFLH